MWNREVQEKIDLTQHKEWSNEIKLKSSLKWIVGKRKPIYEKYLNGTKELQKCLSYEMGIGVDGRKINREQELRIKGNVDYVKKRGNHCTFYRGINNK